MENKITPHLSIVVPVYRCAPCLVELYNRLQKSLPAVTANWEIILVDDKSDDDSWHVLVDLHKKHSNVVLLQLSRNFGQHAAITAGLSQTRGEWVVVLDCDLQDPPEEIINLYKKALEGYDIVYAKRLEKDRSLIRKLPSYFYAKLLNLLSERRFGHQYGCFTIISRAVVDSFLSLKDNDRHYLHILFWLGFSSSEITYEQSSRFAGESSYTFTSLLRHATSGVFFQTTIFLRLVIYCGFFIAFLSLGLTGYLAYRYFFYGVSILGWTSLAALTLFLGGIITTSIGVCGLYIGRIFDQVKERPVFVIKQKLRHESQPAERAVAQL